MKKSIVLLAVLFCSFITLGTLSAQENSYKSGIGLRTSGGYYDLISASYKTFVSEEGAIELNAGFKAYSVAVNWMNLSFSASYQHHFDIGNVEGLKWFIGGGATAFYTLSNASNFKGFGLGLFPTGGVDYKFNNIPLNVSADIRPTFNIIEPYNYYNSIYVGNVGLRYDTHLKIGEVIIAQPSFTLALLLCERY